MLTAINVPELSHADDSFVYLKTRTELKWIKLSGLPPEGVMRHVMGIRLSRYRAAMEAVLLAREGRFVVSHIPRMTAAVAKLLRLRGHRVPHLGFAFNFTELPAGARYRYMRNAIQRVDQLAVFSKFEKSHYARYFDVDPAVFVPVLWAQDPPPVAVDLAYHFPEPYLCAVGGEGRDFPLLLEVAQRLGPSVTVVIIAWAGRLKGLRIPENVQVLTDISLAQVWRIAGDSHGVLVPLLARDTCCGQITLVSAKLLGLPLATTHAHATQEYVEGRETVLACEPGDAAAFAENTLRLIEEQAALKQRAQADSMAERLFHTRRHWAEYLDEFIVQKVRVAL